MGNLGNLGVVEMDDMNSCHKFIGVFSDKLFRKYGRVNLCYQVCNGFDQVVLVEINSEGICANDNEEEVLELFHSLGSVGYGLVILDGETLLDFDPLLEIVMVIR